MTEVNLSMPMESRSRSSCRRSALRSQHRGWAPLFPRATTTNFVGRGTSFRVYLEPDAFLAEDSFHIAHELLCRRHGEMLVGFEKDQLPVGVHKAEHDRHL